MLLKALSLSYQCWAVLQSSYGIANLPATFQRTIISITWYSTFSIGSTFPSALAAPFLQHWQHLSFSIGSTFPSALAAPFLEVLRLHLPSSNHVHTLPATHRMLAVTALYVLQFVPCYCLPHLAIALPNTSIAIEIITFYIINVSIKFLLMLRLRLC